MNKLKISTRLVVLLGLMSALLLGIGGLGLVGISQSNTALRGSYEDRLIPSNQIAEIQRLLLRNRLAIASAQLTPQDAVIQSAIKEVDANIAAITQLWKDYNERGMAPQERVLAEQFLAHRTRFVQEGLRPTLEALRGGDLALAIQREQQLVRPLYEPVGADISALMQYQVQASKADYEGAVSRYQGIRTAAVVSILAGVLLAWGMGIALIRGIRRSLNHAVQVSHAVASGDSAGRDPSPRPR